MLVSTFGRRTLWQSIKYRFWPAYRRQADAELRAGIKWLMDHPEAPCIVGDHFIPNGYGSESRRVS